MLDRHVLEIGIEAFGMPYLSSFKDIQTDSLSSINEPLLVSSYSSGLWEYLNVFLTSFPKDVSSLPWSEISQRIFQVLHPSLCSNQSILNSNKNIPCSSTKPPNTYDLWKSSFDDTANGSSENLPQFVFSKKEFEWTPELEEVFSKIIDILLESPNPSWMLPTVSPEIFFCGILYSLLLPYALEAKPFPDISYIDDNKLSYQKLIPLWVGKWWWWWYEEKKQRFGRWLSPMHRGWIYPVIVELLYHFSPGKPTAKSNEPQYFLQYLYQVFSELHTKWATYWDGIVIFQSLPWLDRHAPFSWHESLTQSILWYEVICPLYYDTYHWPWGNISYDKGEKIYALLNHSLPHSSVGVSSHFSRSLSVDKSPINSSYASDAESIWENSLEDEEEKTMAHDSNSIKTQFWCFHICALSFFFRQLAAPCQCCINPKKKQVSRESTQGCFLEAHSIVSIELRKMMTTQWLSHPSLWSLIIQKSGNLVMEAFKNGTSVLWRRDVMKDLGDMETRFFSSALHRFSFQKPHNLLVDNDIICRLRLSVRHAILAMNEILPVIHGMTQYSERNHPTKWVIWEEILVPFLTEYQSKVENYRQKIWIPNWREVHGWWGERKGKFEDLIELMTVTHQLQQCAHTQWPTLWNIFEKSDSDTLPDSPLSSFHHPILSRLDASAHQNFMCICQIIKEGLKEMLSCWKSIPWGPWHQFNHDMTLLHQRGITSMLPEGKRLWNDISELIKKRVVSHEYDEFYAWVTENQWLSLQNIISLGESFSNAPDKE